MHMHILDHAHRHSAPDAIFIRPIIGTICLEFLYLIGDGRLEAMTLYFLLLAN